MNSPQLPGVSAPRRSARAAANIFKRDGIALVIFLALICLMTNPLIFHLADAVEDKQDALLNTWIIGWVGHALVTDPLNLFNANIFYPYSNTLAFSETMLPQGLFALPFNLAFDNPVLGYNLVLLASFLLAAYAMYLFVFDLTRSRSAAIIAGIIFSFNPYNLGNLAQVQLLSFGWLPLAFLYLRRIMGNWRLEIKRPEIKRLEIKRLEIGDWRLAFLFALFFSLQALSSFYYAFLAGFAVALYVTWFFITHFAHLPWRAVPGSRITDHGSRFTFYVSPLTRLLVSIFLIALFVLPFFLPYLAVQRDLGFERKIAESEPFSASLKLYTEVSPQNVVYGNLLAPRPPIITGGYPLDNLFPGLIALALGIAGIVASKNRERWFYFLLFTFGFVLSLGPRLFVAPGLGTDIPLPYRWLYDGFPLLRALRAPVRFDALVMFALAALAGVASGEWRVTRQPLRILNYKLQITNLLIPLVALEYLVFPAANITPVPTGNAVPQYVRWLATQPPGVILELPMIASDSSKPLDLTTQYLSTYHWHTTPDGYSGFVPPLRGEIAYEMRAFPNDRSLSLLHALDVRYLVIHTGSSVAAGVLPDDLQLVERFGSDQVYRVSARTQDARALSARLYLPQPAAPGQNYLAYLVVENRAARSFAIQPTDLLQVDARWNDGAMQHVTATMPLVTSSVSIVPVSLTAPPRAGTYRLDLRVSGKAIGAWDLSGDVAVQDGEPAHQVVLPARVASSASLKSFYAPGDAVDLALTWQPLNKIDAYYSASVRIVDARGDKIAWQDRQPATPTLLWVPGVATPDRFTLTLPRDLAPGEYSLQLLMYQADIGIDALLLNEKYEPREVVLLANFIVK